MLLAKLGKKREMKIQGVGKEKLERIMARKTWSMIISRWLQEMPTELWRMDPWKSTTKIAVKRRVKLNVERGRRSRNKVARHPLTGRRQDRMGEPRKGRDTKGKKRGERQKKTRQNTFLGNVSWQIKNLDKIKTNRKCWVLLDLQFVCSLQRFNPEGLEQFPDN